MPHFPLDAALTDESDGQGNPCGPYRALLLSDTGGLTQFGAFIEILPPGSRSSLKHWHAEEDELVHVLTGEVLLHEGAAVHHLRPGDTATFKAGVAVGHCLENPGPGEARYLVIGTRAPADVVTYPDHDRVLHLDRREGTRTYSDLAGNPADTPYRA
ncbi:cupin domain-containing protein [Aliigemmobacter aestuarii]|uniref:Cupin domain-containing protein n=1 Tax=Aliigemmobacter aestuarii TaxID=1445661 RepID=A0A4S3MK10_9RHOB|nr:cupin domain-containing protein [Gemmobacter aestuarii]THD81566.1 cupin domain-containing protein [Gemmobacter aestuarii]